MPNLSVKELLESGIHFGHRTSRWNPKMKNYIFGKKKQIHIVNLRETVKGLVRAFHFLKDFGSKGKSILWVGTKRQARDVVMEQAKRTGMSYVADRWLGGTLTNLETIRKRIHRLEELELMESDGSINTYSKKIIASFQRERRKIKRNLEGIRNMFRVPAAIIVVDPRREYIPVAEANRLRIPVIALIDTDSDPENIDMPIPGNDDAMKSIQLVCSKLGDAYLEGASKRIDTGREKEEYRPKPGRVIASAKEVEDDKDKKRKRRQPQKRSVARRTSTAATEEMAGPAPKDSRGRKGGGRKPYENKSDAAPANEPEVNSNVEEPVTEA